MSKWLKEKWEFVVGAIAALVTGLFVLLRINANSNAQKKVLQNANEAHKAELEANKKAKETLENKTEELRRDVEKKVSEIEEDARKKEKELQDEKKKFIESQKKSDKLAKDLADAIGADFVSNDNE